MQARQHAIVDRLLEVVPEDYETECKLILMSGTHQRDIVAHFLTLGHRVVLICTENNSTEEEPATIMERIVPELREETGNSKLWACVVPADLRQFLTEHVKTLTNVDTWFHKVSCNENVISDILSHHRICGLQHQGSLTSVLVMLESTGFDGSTRHEIALLLSMFKANSATSHGGKRSTKMWAVLEPSSWWDKMTYGMWYKTWVSTLSHLLALDGSMDGGSPGKLYTYNEQCVICEVIENAEDVVDAELHQQLRSLL